MKQSFEHYSLPSGQEKELTQSSQWVMDCEQGIYLGARYFRFDAKETVLYLFPSIPNRYDDILLVLTHPRNATIQSYIAHIVQVHPNKGTYQQEVLEAECLESLFNRFLHHYRKKEIKRFHAREFRQHTTTLFACLLILAIQILVATAVWWIGNPLVRASYTLILLWLAIALCGFGGTLVALRPLHFLPSGIQNERPAKKNHQILLGGATFLLEGAILLYEIEANHTLPIIHTYSAWLLGTLILSVPFIIGRGLAPTHPLLAYYPRMPTPWLRPSIAVPLTQAHITRMMRHVWRYPPAVGMNGLPIVSPSTLINEAPVAIIVSRAMATIASSTKVPTITPAKGSIDVTIGGVSFAGTTTLINGAPATIALVGTTISIASSTRTATEVHVVIDGTPLINATTTINGASALIRVTGASISIISSIRSAVSIPATAKIAVAIDGSPLDITAPPIINGALASITATGNTIFIISSKLSPKAGNGPSASPGDISLHTEQIANAIWHRERTPHSLIWVEHWWPSHPSFEFSCTQFHCDRRGTLSVYKRFPVERATLMVLLKEQIEEIPDPTKEGKARTGGTKRTQRNSAEA